MTFSLSRHTKSHIPLDKGRRCVIVLMEVRSIKLMDVPLRPDSASSRCSKPQIRESFWIDPANEPSEPSHAPQSPTCSLRRSCGYDQTTFFSMSVLRHPAPCPDGRRKREGFQGFLRRLLGLIDLTSALLSEPPFLPPCSGRPLRRALTDESAHIMRLLEEGFPCNGFLFLRFSESPSGVFFAR